MSTQRRSLIEQAAGELWSYINEQYGVDIDIPDMQGIMDDNLGFAIEANYEIEEQI